MLAEIITIGDELLIGQTVDTNSAWIGAQLNKIGIAVHQITSIPDERERILQALDDAGKRAQLVLMTGGLGPTTDDITKATFAEFFNVPLERNQEVLAHIEALAARRRINLLDVHRQQADLPKGAVVFINRRGTASGMWMEQEGTVYVSMPGVPYEMKGLMTEGVLPRVEQHFERPAIVHRTVMTIGAGESYIAQRIADWAGALPSKGMKLAYLPSAGQVRIRISASGRDVEALTRAVEIERDALVAQIDELVYGFDDQTLWQVVGELLTQRGLTVATAESCTGGTVAQLLSKEPGSSAFFLGGIVSYANAVKVNQLGVAEADLEQHGAVSQPVVEQMARGARQALQSDYAVATSGVAGPDGGTDEKPVGTVWIAVAFDGGVESQLLRLGNNRQHNIQRSAMAVLDLLRKKILG